MADLQTITIASGSGDTVEQGITKLYADLAKVANTFTDTADPAGLTEGRVWWRSDEQKLYIYTGAAKTEVVARHLLNQDLNFQGNEALTLHLEVLTTGTLPTPAAGTEAQVWYNGTLNLWGGTDNADNFYFAHLNVDASDYIAIPCSLNVAVVTTAAATASTATRRGGWLMDATNEDLNWVAEWPVPAGWTGAHDLILEVSCLLAAAETANDNIDMDMDWITLAPAGGGGTGKTVTASATVNQTIGATAVDQYDAHKVRMVIDHDDVTNTVAKGDYLSGTLKLNSVASVAGIIVTSVTLLVPSFRVAWA